MGWLNRSGTGHDSALWPVLLLLLVVLVPSAGVVWMMRAAMENERLAVRQRLIDAYRTQLAIAQRRVEESWTRRLSDLDSLLRDQQPPSMVFAESVKRHAADATVICDEQGQPLYPAPTEIAVVPVPNADDWAGAARLEAAQRYSDAAKAYADIARDAAESPLVAARARQAEARVLAQQGKISAAIRALKSLSGGGNLNDANGRSLAADAELRLLSLMNPDSPERDLVIQSLGNRLNSYVDPLPSDQRRFLMHSLLEVDPDFEFPTLTAEDLAAEYLATSQPAPATEKLSPTSATGLWQLRTPSRHIVALFQTATLARLVSDELAAQPFPKGVTIAVKAPGDSGRADELVATSLAPDLPGWRLALNLTDPNTFETEADARLAFFLWTGIVVLAITAALALWVGRMLREQSRLTRLKNDLVATVSHELKTPLASIRLLVDTLLDEDGAMSNGSRDPVRTREYLEMISKENSRLSRLIDNFLTFSRMERGKHRFNFEPIDAAAVVDQAVAAVAERFDGNENRLTARVVRPLETIGDADALVTVVMNLLDNAWKYADSPRKIEIVAERAGKWIAISVRDNGIGLSPRAVRRVFDRFYQVDQHLSRSHDGCGLGLSIVKYIVEAHGGRVGVESTLGAGSKFTVSLPAEIAVTTDQQKLAQAPS